MNSEGAYRQDLPGTAQGNWFFPGVYLRTSTDLSSAIALVNDYVDPSQPLFSIGTKVRGVRMGLYSFTPSPPEAAPGRINAPFRQAAADGNVYCYEGLGAGCTAGGLPLGRIDGVPRVEKQGAAGDASDPRRPWQFTGNATLHQR